MAVAYDASSKSAGFSTSTPINFTHTPVGTPAGVAVLVACDSTGTDSVTGATYGGSSLTAVSGGFAQDTAGEPGFCKLYFLGSSIPTGARTVSVSTTGSPNIVCVCITVTASTTTEVYTAGIVLLQGDGTLAEQSVDDGSPGTNSVRFAGMFTGLSTPPSAGASSTVIQSEDDGVLGASFVRETTAGQGSRSVGWSSGTTDDRAAVHFAIRETASSAVLNLMVSGGIVRAYHV